MTVCVFCGGEIDLSRRSTYHRFASGWVAAEGNKSMVLMRTTDEIACNGCIRKMAHGASLDQASLL